MSPYELNAYAMDPRRLWNQFTSTNYLYGLNTTIASIQDPLPRWGNEWAPMK